jgi:uncharacterized DUF497 family protein
MRFDWDSHKDHLNLLKHGISFEQAFTAFDDPFGRVMDDPKHSNLLEKREWLVGESDIGVLVVVFTIRRPGPVYRLISARKANHRERILYEEYKRV